MKEWWMALNTGMFQREFSFSLPKIRDWDRGSPSSRTRTLNIVLKQHFSGLRRNIFKSWNCPVINLIENLWHDMKIELSSASEQQSVRCPADLGEDAAACGVWQPSVMDMLQSYQKLLWAPVDWRTYDLVIHPVNNLFWSCNAHPVIVPLWPY